ncbi:MAG TPA: hypothetical protein VFU21_06355 [Kofleriaceae bacterium]|nr:hypothetical protein [Kofleriaceae bacterium]
MLAIAVGGILVLGLGTVVGLVVGKRLKTGSWSVPTGNDLIRIERTEEAGPPRVIYLHRGPITLTGGEDDAARRISSVVASRGTHSHDHGDDAHASQVSAPGHDRVVKLRGFRGTTKNWTMITRCVARLFAPFDVRVTDVEPPPGTPFIMAVVGGRPKDLGHPHRVGGLAPFNGDVVPGAVVFAFADELRNSTRATCEVIGMEVAHAFGLDHAYACPDVMTYLQGCGKKSFRDLDVRCGESKPRDCHGGAATQNSYRHLLEVLGPRQPPVPAAARTPASD